MESINNNSLLTSFAAGAVAGLTVDVSLFPLDTMKTRLQSKQGFTKAGGFKGIYKGLGPAALGSAPCAAIFFVTYDGMKKVLNHLQGGSWIPISHMASASFAEVVFNVKFVGEVEKYPQLYNYALKEYSKRDATEKAWNQVATEMKMSVSKCKEKWRNLRSTFAKNLKPKQSGGGRTGKRPYYLMEAMQFAIPFMKVAGNPSGNLPSSSPTPEGGEVDVGQEEETLLTEDLASPEIACPVIGSPEIASPATTQQDQATPGPSTDTRGPHGYPIRKRKLGRAQGDAEQAFSDYFAAKKAKLAPKEGSSREEGIRHFLISLMPDLVQMKDVQLRKFKRRALELVEEVGEEPVVEFVPPQSYSGSAGYPYGYPDYTMLAPALPQQTPGHSHSTNEGSIQDI